MPRPSEIQVVEEAREPPPPGPGIAGEPRGGTRAPEKDVRVRDDARGPVCSGEGRARQGSQNLHRSGSVLWGCAHRPIPGSRSRSLLASSEGSSPHEP